MRNYKFDNLKCIMIFLVIFGHCLEAIKGDLSKNLYIFIYTFHMPIFVFITGYFAKCSKKRVIKFVKIYVIWQTIYLLYDKYFLSVGTSIQYHTPNRFLWYIFAMIIWFAMLKIFDTKDKKIAIMFVLLSFASSIVLGFWNDIGYKFSVSRIITFLPYFLLGYYSKKFKWEAKEIYEEKNNRILFSIVALISIIYFLSIKDTISSSWLYGSYSYENGNYNFIFKIMWILLSLVEMIIFLSVVPNEKIKFVSAAGANTLWTFLFHGLFVKAFPSRVLIFKYSEFINIVLALMISIAILTAFGIALPNLLSKIENKEKEHVNT